MCLGPFAMVGLTLADAVRLPGMRELIVEIGEEAMRAGQDLGYPVEPILGLRKLTSRAPIGQLRSCSTSSQAISGQGAVATRCCRTY